MTCYGTSFFDGHRGGSYRSAAKVVPLVLQWVKPDSVVDVGCGIGTWLKAFIDHGITDVVGVDGDYVDRNRLLIPRERFVSFDLEQPLRLERTFDLAVSLEVAEHLPPETAEPFIESLTRLAPVILFSAAIPYQGGTHHVNEQWPEYWAELMGLRQYVALDIIRPKIWSDPAVEWWYAQNTLLFVRRSDLDRYPELRAEADRQPSRPLSIVHPRRYESMIAWDERLRRATDDVARVVPAEGGMVLADENQWGVNGEFAGRRAVPLVERDGVYWGRPADDEQAVGELRRHISKGARYVVFGWPAFWWLEHYPSLAQFLHSSARCLLRNDRVAIFEVNGGFG